MRRNRTIQVQNDDRKDRLQVFIGSSTEAKRLAREVSRLITTEMPSASVIPWWDDRAFPPGPTLIESLEQLIKRTNAAIILATPDDKRIKRGSAVYLPRDNIVLEYGMFAAFHGRPRCGLATVEHPELPSDLDGVTRIRLRPARGGRNFRQANRREIRKWLVPALQNLQMTPTPPEAILPRLYKTIVNTLTRPPAHDPEIAQAIDQLTADLFERIAATFEGDFGFGSMINAMTETNLTGSVGIWAVDVLGPAAWVNPTAYRYLALQIRHYLSANATTGGFDFSVGSVLATALRKADARAGAQSGGPWHAGTPRCQYARILLWSRSELLNPVAESIIAIHQAFHVPLFYLETPSDAPRRAFDYIAFEHAAPSVVGFKNRRATGFKPEPLVRGKIPGNRNVLEHFNELLADPNLVLAAERREELSA